MAISTIGSFLPVRQFCFIDTAVADRQAIVAGLPAQAAWVRLDVALPAVEQMVAALAQQRDLAALHIVSHGAPGQLQLAGRPIEVAGLDAQAAHWAALGAALAPGGTLVLYGCEVGQGARGRALVDRLAELTGRDVLASSQVSGGLQPFLADVPPGARRGPVVDLTACAGRLGLVTGSDGADNLQGGEGDDTLLGLGGDDSLFSGLGNDLLDGGDGNDQLSVSVMAPGLTAQLLGGAGADMLWAGPVSVAQLDGGADNDWLTIAGVPTSTLAGGLGDDMLSAVLQSSLLPTMAGDLSFDQRTTLDGGDGQDVLIVQGYSDAMAGQIAATLTGGAGNDTLAVSDATAGSFFGAGRYGIARAVLDGGDGDDVLRASGVVQLGLTGGAGSDTFMLTAQQWRTLQEGTRLFTNADGTTTEVAAGPTVITDFQAGAGGDVLELSELLNASGFMQDGSNPFSPGGPLRLTQLEGAVQLQFLGTTVALLQGVTLTELVSTNLSPAHAPDGSPPPGQLIEGSASGDALYGGAGSDTVLGLDGDDWLQGRAGADWLDGGAGNDFLYGETGDDTLLGGAGADQLGDGNGSDLLDGGDGNDTLSVYGSYTVASGPDRVLLQGGAGDDQLAATDWAAGNFGGTGHGLAEAVLDGGDGNDQLRAGGVLQLTLTGGAGSDTFVLTLQQWRTLQEGTRVFSHSDGTTTEVAAGPTVITDFQAGAGGDVLDVNELLWAGGFVPDGSNPFGPGGPLRLTQVEGAVQLQFQGTTVAVLQGATLGSLQASNLSPAHAPDGSPPPGMLIEGSASGDTLYGGAGSDTVLGLDGDDWLQGAAGADRLDGGEGNDILYGETGDDTLLGGAGADQLADGDGSDWLDGGDGNDTLGVYGVHAVASGIDRVQLQGGAGDDQLVVTDWAAGNFGGTGHGLAEAVLDGGDGNDQLRAGGVLQLGLTGGAGSDTFVLTAQQWRTQLEGTRLFTNADGTITEIAAGPALITDFQAGAGGDVLDVNELLSASGFVPDGSNPFGPGGPLRLTQVEGAVQLQFQDTTVAVLQGVTLGALLVSNLSPGYPPDGTPPPGQLLTGGDGNDTLPGGFGADTLLGLGGDDWLDGSAGADLLAGGDGADSLYGGLGQDSLDGGTGNDWLDGGAGSDTLLGGEGHDVLTDGPGSSTLDGGAGDDNLSVYAEGYGQLPESTALLSGGAGLDSLYVSSADTAWLDGGDDNDALSVYGVRNATLQGGAGDDQLAAQIDGFYSMPSGGSAVPDRTALLDGGDGNDQLSAGSYISTMLGQAWVTLQGRSGNDTLTVSDAYAGNFYGIGSSYGIAQAMLDGGDGDDMLRAGGVLQLGLTGGAGSDTFVLTAQQWRTQLEGTRVFNNPDTTITEMAAGPTFITDFQAGAGGDVLDVSELLSTSGFVQDGSNPFGPGGPLQLTQVEGAVQLQFQGTTVAVLQGVTLGALLASNLSPGYPPDGTPPPGQLLTGGDGSDTLPGGFGADTLLGLGGDDWLEGREGADLLAGGDGADTLQGGTGQDSLEGDAGNDWLDGGEGHDTLLGAEGDDVLNGAYGDDTLLGGLGNDILTDSQGSTWLDGGDGHDTLSVSSFDQQGATARLIGGSGLDQLAVSYLSTAQLDGGEDQDILSAYDVRTASLAGGGGDDTLGVVLDTYYSVITDGDAMLGESAVLDGGDGNDSLTAAAYTWTSYGRARLDLQGGAGNDTLSVSDVWAGSPYGLGSYTGIAQAVLAGGDGDDQLRAGGVLQLTLIGGAGADTFVLTAQQWRTQLEGARLFVNADGATTEVAAGPAVITDFQAGAGGDVLDVSELLNASGFVPDGSNPFSPGGPLQLVAVEAGVQLQFLGTTVAVLQGVAPGTLTAANLSPGHAPDGSPPQGVLIDGSETADTLLGRLGPDTLHGFGGDDWLDGREGADLLDGGDGADSLYGGTGQDSLAGGAGNDWLDGGSGDDLLQGGDGNDTLDDRQGSSTLDGGAGNDILNAYAYGESGAAAVLGGGDGADLLSVSYLRTAELDGGADNDTLSVYGACTTRLDGGSGDDRLDVLMDGYYTTVIEGAAALDRSATLHGGAGNDTLSVSDPLAGHFYGALYDIGRAELDGGDGDDQLRAGGVLQLTLTGGVGSDTFVLTAQQWRTQLEGTQVFNHSDGTITEVAAGPTVITDFQAGAGGDVLDVNELLAASGYVVDSSTNPFAAGGPLQLVQVEGTVQLQCLGTTVAVLRGVLLESLVVGNISPAFDPSGNLAPTAQDSRVALAEDGAHVFSVADFGFADADPGNTLQAVTLLALPEQGRLTLHGEVVTAGQRVGIESLEAGALVFVPAADAHADAYALIGFSVSDGRLDSAAHTLTLDVQAVNDAPRLQVAVADLVAAQDHAFGAELPAGMFSDVDDAQLSLAVTLADGSTLPDWLVFDAATQRLSGTPLAADAGPAGQVLDLLVTATDPGGASASGLVRLSIDASLTLNGNGAANQLEGRGADDHLNGLAGSDTLMGLGGDDTLDGGSGADRLLGGTGNDVYRIDNRRDVVVELAGEGLDRVEASVSHTLAAAVENLTLLGRDDLRGSGNALDNVLVGNRGDNALDGGAGDDRLVGGAGDDTLTGGLGADVFVFDAALNARSNLDELRDFRHGTDHLALDTGVFTALAGLGALQAGMLRTGAGVTRALDADDHLIYDTSSGHLYYDADGVGGAAAVQFAQLRGHASLTAEDFLIGV